MRQFINGSNSNWEQLEHQATGKCIRFRDQEMPPGSIPCQAHVGFEVNAVEDTFQFGLENLFVESVGGDAVVEDTTGVMVLIVHDDVHAVTAQIVSRGQTSRTGADNSHLLSAGFR